MESRKSIQFVNFFSIYSGFIEVVDVAFFGKENLSKVK